eukprot:CAMPEP_0194145116 /NCGR_PEP_ID=MMETSP0152-20130528/14943_1 /TAXON_ID=1049557 /ORGANISM="Thalassiothrix antarctica, Strain L6-D1" /LENGTH=41 /DNA_ID= /DNA_START= /DNA_END= /DNA_ORIENTATION=
MHPLKKVVAENQRKAMEIEAKPQKLANADSAEDDNIANSTE